MVTVLAVGAAVVDVTLRVAEPLPLAGAKYRATQAAIVGGGCAATAAVAVARLGGRAVLSGRLGADPIGEMVLAGLRAERVETALVRRFDRRRSSFSTVVVDSAGERQIVNFRDPDMPADAGWLAAADWPAVGAVLADTRWPEGAAVAMERARRLGVPGVIDAEAPVGIAADALRMASHIAFSSQGLADFTGTAEPADGLVRAADATGARVCVTDGAAGVWWLDGATLRHLPAFAVTVVDTLGAGDVWHGAFALALAEGRCDAHAIRFASAAAALKCTRPGGRDGAPSRAELNAFLKETTP